MYHFNGRVRYSEVDENRQLTVDMLINYLQDCCCFQSEDLGVGLDYWRDHQIAWVIGGWQIEIARMPVYGEAIDVQTWPYRFAGFRAERNFRIDSADGEHLVQADSNWVLVDAKTGRPTRITKEHANLYTMEPALEMERPPRKLRIDETLAEAKEPFAVQQKHLDTNHHVNNGQYVVMALEYMPAGQHVSQIKVEYKHPAVLGDTIYPLVVEKEREIQVALCNEEKRPYAVVILKYQNEQKK